ncbi:hypothetical protein AWZ03_013973 [Drosophila navojoa]|uniref:Ubiquitin-like domain-containing protein n=1 Tax=Drosophila navojoa TaxID=7232 RepID=A0A484ASP0_DRONA|nr:hypothetical protein AWZ03_013973 [Drosophila navojoa]
MDKSTTTNTTNAKDAMDATVKNEPVATNGAGCGSSGTISNNNIGNSSINNNNNKKSSDNNSNNAGRQAFSQPAAMAAAIATTSALLSSTNSSTTLASRTGLVTGTGTERNNMMINLNISTTTGGNFSVSVEPHISIESLKKIIAKKLKVAKDRICLLHREK